MAREAWRKEPPQHGDRAAAGNLLAKDAVECVVSEGGPVARAFATALAASIGGACRHTAAAMVSAAWREPSQAAAGPVLAEAGSETGQRLAVIEAALCTQQELAKDQGGVIKPLAPAISDLRQLNAANKQAKHLGEEIDKGAGRSLRRQASEPHTTIAASTSSSPP